MEVKFIVAPNFKGAMERKFLPWPSIPAHFDLKEKGDKPEEHQKMKTRQVYAPLEVIFPFLSGCFYIRWEQLYYIYYVALALFNSIEKAQRKGFYFD